MFKAQTRQLHSNNLPLGVEGAAAGVDEGDDAKALGGGGSLALAVRVGVAVGVRVLVVLVLLAAKKG